VLALQDEGKTADEIVAAFVEKYGEKVLMAPKPEGFNIVGYVLPSLAVLLVGGVMFAILRQRTRMVEVARKGTAAGPAMPAGAARAVVGAAPATAEELARLEQELKELDQ
jgi:cytochrome c-type biogenesis protein CcmH/NrfF